MCVLIGPPSLEARLEILHSCVLELMTKGVIHPREPLRRLSPAQLSSLGGNEQRLYKLALMTDVQYLFSSNPTPNDALLGHEREESSQASFASLCTACEEAQGELCHFEVSKSSCC